MQTFVEYRVRPVTRYVVTRYERQLSDCGNSGTCSGIAEKGEFDNAKVAYEVGYALAKDEHRRLGYPPGDERIQYPERIEAGLAGQAKSAANGLSQAGQLSALASNHSG